MVQNTKYLALPLDFFESNILIIISEIGTFYGFFLLRQ